jgi:hypothetical protein
MTTQKLSPWLINLAERRKTIGYQGGQHKNGKPPGEDAITCPHCGRLVLKGQSYLDHAFFCRREHEGDSP